MRLEPILKPDLTLCVDDVADRDDLLHRLAKIASSQIPTQSVESIFHALEAREEQTPTATSEGVAFPHAMLDDVGETLLIVMKLTSGVSFTSSDLPASDIIFCMIGSAGKPWAHVRLLARLARIARGVGALDRLRAATTADELFERLIEEDRAHGE